MTGLEKVTLRYISLIMKGNHNLLWVKFVGGDRDSTCSGDLGSGDKWGLSFAAERALVHK